MGSAWVEWARGCWVSGLALEKGTLSANHMMVLSAPHHSELCANFLERSKGISGNLRTRTQ